MPCGSKLSARRPRPLIAECGETAPSPAFDPRLRKTSNLSALGISKFLRQDEFRLGDLHVCRNKTGETLEAKENRLFRTAL